MQKVQRFSFSQSAIYQIKVSGVIDQKLMDKLGGMQIIINHKDVENPCSTLTGEISDQAALNGIINSIYELRFSVMSINCLKPNLSNPCP